MTNQTKLLPKLLPKFYPNPLNTNKEIQKIKLYLFNNTTQLIDIHSISDIKDLHNKYEFWEYI